MLVPQPVKNPFFAFFLLSLLNSLDRFVVHFVKSVPVFALASCCAYPISSFRIALSAST